MNRKFKVLIISVSVLFQLFSCILPVAKRSTSASIFSSKDAIMILAETFPQYEWNEDAKNANALYLRGLNDFYFKRDYVNAIILFYDAIETYPYDARFYVRLAESQARTDDFNGALSTLTSGDARLPGLLTLPGIDAYVRELNSAQQIPADSIVNTQPKSIIQRVTGTITWVPRKTYSFFRNLF